MLHLNARQIFDSLISLSKFTSINFGIPYPVGIYLLKVNNRNTRTRCEICSKLTIKTMDNGVVLVSLLLTLNNFPPCSGVSIANFEHVNVDWVCWYSIKTGKE